MPPRPHPELLREVGALIRHHRERRRLTQGELAAKSGLSVEFVGRVERGDAPASVSSLAELSSALGVEVRDLFGLERYAASDAGSVMARIVGQLAPLGDDDLEWVERVLLAALSRKPRR